VTKAALALHATVDENFAEIDRLVRKLRQRIAVAAEAVYVASEKANAQALARKGVTKERLKKPKRV
jgi:hypothetical protein